MRKKTKNLFIVGVGLAASYGAMKAAAEIQMENYDIDYDDVNTKSYVPTISCKSREYSVYERKVKRALDQIFSFCALITLSPLLGLISFAIYVDDPGPALFTQKRIGKGKSCFTCHKFRSMCMDAPHDVPTHQLADSQQYITKVGRMLRKTSLDELPQLWDVWRGRMSIVGPRPALWNQQDLITERDKWDANSVLPGITGLAQIKGRDELPIAKKAKLDGEYVSALKAGGLGAFLQDMRIALYTVPSVLKRDGIMEGGDIRE